MTQDFGQMELFPRATDEEIEITKLKLEEYEKCLKLREAFEEDGLDDLSETELESYKKCVREMRRIERAVKLILDPTIRELIEYRYIQCNSYSATSYHFTKMMDDRTVDRKLNKGIESIAESLKLWQK